MIHQTSQQSPQRPASRQSAAAESLLPRGVNLCGYLRTESGVGAAARGYVRALEESGLPLARLDISGLQTNRSKDNELSHFDQEHPFDINLVCADVELHYSILSHFGDELFKDRYNIGLWAWELPRFPKRWFDRFAYYDEIWVASSFIADSLASVSPIPVVRMPPPLTLLLNGSRERGRQRFDLTEDELLFLFVFDFHSHIERKNPAAAIEAFRQAFNPADSARLVLKCVNADSNREGFDQLQRLAAGARIELHDGYWPSDEIRDLMAACDAYVSLHRSEGIGLTITDAMALGKPVIATGWSGNMDFMNVGNSFPLSYELVQIERSVGPYQAGETWAEPSIEHAAHCMRIVFDDRNLALARGRAAEREIATFYSATAVAQRISQRLETIGIRRRWPEFQRQMRERFTEYQRLPDQIQHTVRESLPAGARVLVVSKGDSRLTDLDHCEGWHFPQTDDGQYAGYYPADSQEAIEQLERLRTRGAEFLLFPSSAYWWLQQYDAFARHLDSRYHKIADNDQCIVYELVPGRASLGRLERQLRHLAECEQTILQLAAKTSQLNPTRESNGRKHVPSAAEPKQDDYQRLIARIRNVVQSVVPKGAHVFVISKGDPELLKLPHHLADHFPQAKSGGYAGHHPANSATAIAQLESLRREEPCYLLIPSTAYWWLGHYVEFRRHLEGQFQRFWNDDHCAIYDLSPQTEPARGAENGHAPAKRSLLSKLRHRLALGPAATNGRRPS